VARTAKILAAAILVHARMAQEAETNLPTERDPETWYWEGSLFTFCGKKQAALHLLQSAIEPNYCARENLLVDPLLAKLRTDSAFSKLLATACQEGVRAPVFAIFFCQTI